MYELFDVVRDGGVNCLAEDDSSSMPFHDDTLDKRFLKYKRVVSKQDKWPAEALITNALIYMASDVGSEIGQQSRSFITRVIRRCWWEFHEERTGMTDDLFRFVLDFGKSNKSVVIRMLDSLRGNFEQTSSKSNPTGSSLTSLLSWTSSDQGAVIEKFSFPRPLASIHRDAMFCLTSLELSCFKFKQY